MKGKHRALAGWSAPFPPTRRRQMPAPSDAFAGMASFALAMLAEFDRAARAAHRYEQLKRRAPADAARRIHAEFYAGR